MKKTALAITFLLLAGCLGPPYHPPQVATPQQWSQTANGVRVQESAAAPWWPAFGDTTLDTLIGDAIARNDDLQVAIARVREARALRGVAASRGKPQVGGSASGSESQRSSNIPPFDALPPGLSFGDRRGELFDTGFDASWELDLFGGIRRDVEAAVAQVQAIDEARRDVEISLAAEVARNYVELRGAQKRLDVLDARIQTLRDTLDMVRARQQGGLTNDLDVARSEALLDDTLALRPSLEYAIAAAMHRLAVLAGRQPGDLTPELAAHQPVPGVPSEIAIATPAGLIAQRPDVRRAERELAAATARIGVARADLYPRVALLGGFGNRSDDWSDLIRSGSGYWSIGPSLRWPLLTGGRVHAQIDAQTARREQAEASLRATVLRAFEEVENSLGGFARDQHERERLTAAVASEGRAVDLADARYRAGLDNFLAVLDAQRTLRDGEDRLAAADTRVALSAVSLYKSLGSVTP